VGRLLGDPEVWDDTPARPRPAARGLAGLALGPPEVRLPPAAEAPKLRVENQILYSASLGGGPLLVTRSGRLEPVNADGTDRRAAVVVATHDPEVVELCDRVVRLVDGRPLELTPGDVGGPVA
jgi:hypothetical protein